MVNTQGRMHEDKAYVKDPTRTIDGVKTGEMDEMFKHEEENQDGGAIQYITPFNVFDLQKSLHMLKEVK